jgi:hypothetical protein
MPVNPPAERASRSATGNQMMLQKPRFLAAIDSTSVVLILFIIFNRQWLIEIFDDDAPAIDDLPLTVNKIN